MDTSIFGGINWLAVLVAAIAYFMLGAIWYGPLFSKKWIAYQRIDMSDPNAKSGVGAIMSASFVITIFMCLALAILIERLGITSMYSGAKVGLLTGLAFSMGAISMTYLYIKRPAGLHFIDGGYHIVGQVIAGIILAAWN